ANVTTTVANGTLNISTPSLNFGSNSVFQGPIINVDSGGGANDLAVTTTTGFANSGLASTGGAITISPTAGRSVIFAQSGAGTSTLNLNGGPVTATVSGTGTATVNTGVTVASNNNIII